MEGELRRARHRALANTHGVAGVPYAGAAELRPPTNLRHLRFLLLNLSFYRRQLRKLSPASARGYGGQAEQAKETKFLNPEPLRYLRFLLLTFLLYWPLLPLRV
jgi:hypothetical protein